MKVGRVADGKFVAITGGITKGQMQHLFGRPAAKHGRCWQYSLPVNKYLASQHVVKEVFSVCFYEGRVSDTSERDYVRSRGKLVPYRPQ